MKFGNLKFKPLLKIRDGEYEGEKEGFGKVARLLGFGKNLQL